MMPKDYCFTALPGKLEPKKQTETIEFSKEEPPLQPQKKRKVLLFLLLLHHSFLSFLQNINLLPFPSHCQPHPSRINRAFLIKIHDQRSTLSGYQQKCAQMNRHTNHTERRTIFLTQLNFIPKIVLDQHGHASTAVTSRMLASSISSQAARRYEICHFQGKKPPHTN